MAPGARAAAALFTLLLAFAPGHFLSCLLRAVNAVLTPQLTAALRLGPAQLGMLSGVFLFGFALARLPVAAALRHTDWRGLFAALAGATLFAALAGATLLAGVPIHWLAPRDAGAAARPLSLAGWTAAHPHGYPAQAYQPGFAVLIALQLPGPLRYFLRRRGAAAPSGKMAPSRVAAPSTPKEEYETGSLWPSRQRKTRLDR